MFDESLIKIVKANGDNSEGKPFRRKCSWYMGVIVCLNFRRVQQRRASSFIDICCSRQRYS